MKRRLLVAGAAPLLLFLAVAIVWIAFGAPPPRLVVEYGLPPAGGPTGRTEVVEGVEFGPGHFLQGSTAGAGGDLLGTICRPLGLPWGEAPSSTDEMPVRWVEIPRAFWIARTEATNEQYERFDPKHVRSEYSPGDRHPVVDVSWNDAKRYCAWLAERCGFPVRLPTESEWEYACRGGSTSEWCFGDDEADLARYAWYGANVPDGAREVGTRRANAWGLHDLHGNAWEWCEDEWHDDYEGSPTDGSAWLDAGAGGRVVRGGCWWDDARFVRSAYRCWGDPESRDDYLGFRPARPSTPR